MADVKWIKITTDIFDDEKILLIESLPDAYAIITVWFKLLCLAGKQNNSGVFMMGHIAYTDKMLATIFRMKEATVTMALQTFEQFGMVAIIDGVITIPNWGKHQNLDQLESKKEYMRNYMKDYREKQKALTVGKPSCKTNSKSNVSQADKEEDREIEKESDREKKRKRESRKKQNDIFTLFDNLYPSYSLSEILIEKMREWITYKAERNEAYAEQGMKSLLRQVKNKADEFGDVAVCDLIDECMSSNWKGIIFDRLIGKVNRPIKNQNNSSFNTDGFFEAAVARAQDEMKAKTKTAAEDEDLRKRASDLAAELKEKYK